MTVPTIDDVRRAPEATSHGFADNRDRLGTAAVGIGEQPAVTKGQLKCGEVLRRNPGELYLRAVIGGRMNRVLVEHE